MRSAEIEEEKSSQQSVTKTARVEQDEGEWKQTVAQHAHVRI